MKPTLIIFARALVLVLICFARISGATIDPATGNARPIVPEIAAAGYQLGFSDEFNGTGLDQDKWIYRTDSKMLSTQLPANVSVSGGALHIVLKKEDANGRHYTGGGIISRAFYLYGYYEARLKVPSGAGWHTSFWLQRHDGSGGTGTKGAAQEIDICEQTSPKPTYSAGVIDWGLPAFPKGLNFGRKYIPAPGLPEDFHVWSCEFTHAKVKFFFDGKLTHEVDATKFKHRDENIWLTAIATVPVDDSKLPATADFDYVRYYAPPPPAAP